VGFDVSLLCCIACGVLRLYGRREHICRVSHPAKCNRSREDKQFTANDFMRFITRSANAVCCEAPTQIIVSSPEHAIDACTIL
jgi:hypothetical protein